jgi:hypothetical protein
VGGQALDPQRGILAARAVDCNGMRTAGVTLRLTGGNAQGSVPYTIHNDLATFGTLSGDRPVSPIPTDSRGVAGFENLLPGVVTVEGVLDNQKSYGSVAIRIRANQLSEAELRPITLRPK